MENSNTTNLTKETSLHYIIKTNINGSLSIEDVYGELSLIQQLGLLEYVKNEITKKLKFGDGVDPINLNLSWINTPCKDTNRLGVTPQDHNIGYNPHDHSKQLHKRVDENTWTSVPDPHCVDNQFYYNNLGEYVGPMIVGETITKNEFDAPIDAPKLLKISDIVNDKYWIPIEYTSLFGNKLLSKFTPQIYNENTPTFIGQDIYFGAILKILRVDTDTNICEFIVYYVDFMEFKFSVLFSNTLKNLQDKLKFHNKLLNLLFDVKIAHKDFPEQVKQFLLLSKRKTSNYVTGPENSLIYPEKMTGMEIKPIMMLFDPKIAQSIVEDKFDNVFGLNIDYFHQSKNWKQLSEKIVDAPDLNYQSFQDASVTFECYVQIVSMFQNIITEIKIWMRENPEFDFKKMSYTFVKSDLPQENVFENLIIQLNHAVFDNKFKNDLVGLIVDENGNIYNPAKSVLNKIDKDGIVEVLNTKKYYALSVDFFNKSANWVNQENNKNISFDKNHTVFRDNRIDGELYVEFKPENNCFSKFSLYYRSDKKHSFSILDYEFQEISENLLYSDILKNKCLEIIRIHRKKFEDFEKLNTTENINSVKQLNTLFESIRPKIDPEKIEAASIYGTPKPTPEYKFEHINDEAPIINFDIDKYSDFNNDKYEIDIVDNLLTVDNLIATNDWVKINQEEVDFILTLNIFRKNIFSEPTNILFGKNNNFGLFMIIDYKNINITNSIIKKYCIFAFDFISSNIANLGNVGKNEVKMEEFSYVMQQFKERHVKLANHPLSAGYPNNQAIKNILHSKN